MLLDSINLIECHRERLYGIAERLVAKLLIVRVKAPLESVRHRLQRRSEAQGEEAHSDADWRICQRMRPSVDSINCNHFVDDTSKDVAPVIDKVVRGVNKWIRT